MRYGHARRRRGDSSPCICLFPAIGQSMMRIMLQKISNLDIREALGGVVTVFTHLEPAEDELSMEDIFLDR